ncbi:Putative glycosyltransferase EpsH [Acetatifactor muris]|jgi:glycosyltransferase involved in cell wall biosynthesis|uniref:Glycosyltransferase EpsH n=2 Tax=Acetatifactor muris TaxID=879566 RepID=A0A2K4ZCF6_9FIRM|nr:Putative glycosyltransferase EpsH [Acetatifactor muris]
MVNKMKLLSIAIPCYNSEGYMAKCVESLLAGGEDVEIIIVDDGSTKDGTARVADEYAQKYPSIVKAVHQENGGHGSAVNTGIQNATGLYFKVVDSDDWVKKEAYLQVLDTLRELAGGACSLDMLVCNFVYEKEGEKRKKVMHYRHILPQGEMFTWKDCHHFSKGHYILMHSVIFRTRLLRECGLELPKHTFYVDNIYVFEPLPFVKNIYYLDVNLYRYYIGREGQSVNEATMISRIDQQIKVNKIMIDYFVDKKQELLKDKRLYQYMYNYLEIITTVSSVLLIRSGTEENLEKKKELWKYLKAKDKKLFTRMRHGIMGSAMNLPGKSGRKISVGGYKICQKIFKFN